MDVFTSRNNWMKKKLQNLPCKLSIQNSFTLQEFNSYERRIFLNSKTMSDLDLFVDDFCKFESEENEEIKFCARVSSSSQVGNNSKIKKKSKKKNKRNWYNERFRNIFVIGTRRRRRRKRKNIYFIKI